MSYPEFMIRPMREELTRLGVEELRTPEAVDEAIKNSSGTIMVVVRREKRAPALHWHCNRIYVLTKSRPCLRELTLRQPKERAATLPVTDRRHLPSDF